MKLFESELVLGERVAVGGLPVFPLIGPGSDGAAYLTGPEALESSLVEVAELDPPQVPFLRVVNLADLPLLLLEGEMVVGADQNRTLNVSVLVPARSSTVVPVSCVEQGRWGRGSRRSVSDRSSFAPGTLRSKKVQNLEPQSPDRTGRLSSQDIVWGEVSRYETERRRYSETSALDDLQQAVEDEVGPELEFLSPLPNQVGVVSASGDRVIGMDLFDRPATLESYLRSIVAGHMLDAVTAFDPLDPVAVVRALLGCGRSRRAESGPGCGPGRRDPAPGRGDRCRARVRRIACLTWPRSWSMRDARRDNSLWV